MDMFLTKTYQVYCILLFYGVLTSRAVKPEGAGGQLLPPSFGGGGSSVNPIPTRGTYFSHPITICPPPRIFRPSYGPESSRRKYCVCVNHSKFMLWLHEKKWTWNKQGVHGKTVWLICNIRSSTVTLSGIFFARIFTAQNTW